MKIILAAVVSLPPYSAGRELHRLGYIKGLTRLGHEVFFVEEVKSSWCVDDKGLQVPYRRSINRRRFFRAIRSFGLDGRACQILEGGSETTGMSMQALTKVAEDADLLFNWSGHLKTDRVLSKCKRRVYLDQDPVYTQLWHAEYGVDLNFAMHHVFVSVGLNIGTPHSCIPNCGKRKAYRKLTL